MMKKVIVGCLVMVSAMVMGNTNNPYTLWSNSVSSLVIANSYLNGNGSAETNGLIKGMPQVSSYCVVVTNYSRERMLVGIKGDKNDIPMCKNWEYVTWSLTDYYETETVIKSNMLKYDIDGIIGETCIKKTVLSKKRREVKQKVISETKLVTNDWVTVGEDQRWFALTNIVELTSLTVTNYINTNYWSNLIKE